MAYPKYVKIKDKTYKINTSYKVAIKCNEIAENEKINDIERALSIIYVLFGEEALNDKENWEELLIKAKKYLSCNQEQTSEEESDIDYIQDMPYIKASFMSDYNIDLNEKDLHYWEFFELLSGLSNSDMGNCCILNRIINLRNCNLSEIQDSKEREKIRKAKQRVAIKRKRRKATLEEQKSAREFYTNLFRKE